LDATLVKGRNGVFEVTFDDELIYSKKTQGRFPEPGEVESVIRQKLSA
jgi:selenoprotein W-related protein